MLRRIAPGASARTAPANTAKSPQFLAEADQSKIEIGPIDGPGMEKMVNGLYEIEPAILSE